MKIIKKVQRYNLNYGAELLCGFVENPDLIRVAMSCFLSNNKTYENDWFFIRTTDGYFLQKDDFWEFIYGIKQIEDIIKRLKRVKKV